MPKRTPSDKKEERLREEKKSRKKLIVKIIVSVVITVAALMMLASRFFDYSFLDVPRRITAAITAPVQEFVSSAAAKASDYLRRLKLRSRLEEEYAKLLEINEELRNENAILSDYENRLNSLLNLQDLLEDFSELDPIPATVISHDTGSYFSVLEINAGTQSGVREFMAVVADGGLVGYTYDVDKSSCKVRCIIDSEATVAGMLQNSRDQGSVTGTLGVDGTAMCRMYYLPETSLPRPGERVITSGVGMEFPQGIPIGTVRESTRSLDDSKSFVVLEPLVDFQHIEHVLVLGYVPSYAEDAQVRSNGTEATLVPLITKRPVSTDFQFHSGIGFATPTPVPEGWTADTPVPSFTEPPSVTATPAPGTTPDASASPRPTNRVYVAPDPNATPTPTPTPVPTPTPTPMPTFNPASSMEDDD